MQAAGSREREGLVGACSEPSFWYTHLSSHSSSTEEAEGESDEDGRISLTCGNVQSRDSPTRQPLSSSVGFGHYIHGRPGVRPPSQGERSTVYESNVSHYRDTILSITNHCSRVDPPRTCHGKPRFCSGINQNSTFIKLTQGHQ